MKFRTLIILVVILATAGPAGAVEKNFSAGSWIIPMDEPYQPAADQGLFEAYGLVWELLANGVTVHWIIAANKTAATDVDLNVFNVSVSPVVEEVVHGGGTMPIPGVSTFINYTGGPFVIDVADVPKARAVLQDPAWDQVNIHEAKVAFSANVQRTLSGTPPKIALMNDTESTTTGNAIKILASYLVLANICGDAYEVVTPNQIRDGILQRTTNPFSLLWAPHWAGFEKAPYDTDSNGNGIVDADEITMNIRKFLEAGNSMFAECASIEVFEHSKYGHFLTDDGTTTATGHGGGIGHNGGTMDATRMHFNGVDSPFAQMGSLQYVPTGGHLHNWRPFHYPQDVNGPPAEPYNKKGGYTPVPSKTCFYNPTVTRFAFDDANGLNLDPDADADQWDYYVGGYLDGDPTKGYVVYLGGHTYGDKACATSVLGGGGTVGVPGPAGTHFWSIQFDAPPLPGTAFDLTVSGTDSTGAPFTAYAGNLKFDGLDRAVGTVLQLDFSNVQVNGSTISNIAFNNVTGGTLTISEVRIRRSDGATTPKVVRVWDQDVAVDFYNGRGLALEAVVPKARGCTSNYQIASASADTVNIEWKKDLNSGSRLQQTTFTVVYNNGKRVSIDFDGRGNVSPASMVTSADGRLQIDFSGARFSGEKVDGVVLRNLKRGTLNIDSVEFSWTGGHEDQKLKKFKYNNGSESLDIDSRSVASGAFGNNCGGAVPTVQIAPAGNLSTTVTTSCGDNSACGWKNAAAVRWVLNTLFNLQFTVNNTEFSRSAPIVDKDNLLLAGSFDYPSWRGHLRAYDAGAPGSAAVWDAAAAMPAADARHLFTNTGGLITDGLGLDSPADYPVWTPFDVANVGTIGPLLELSAQGGASQALEDLVINRVKGKEFVGTDPANPADYRDMRNRLGAIEHSAAAIVGPTDLPIANGATRPRMAYVGTLDGVLEAIDAGTQGSGFNPGTGAEKWGFIPRELLHRLQNDRTDPKSAADYAAVDASPTVADVYIDYDQDGTPEPRTVLVGAEGYGGNSIFAMDISDPTAPQLLWEATDIRPPQVSYRDPYLIELPDTDTDGDGNPDSVQMGHAYKTAISRVFLNTNPPEVTYVVYVATGYAVPGNWLGGVRVYCFRLDNAKKLWEFHANYLRSVNDIPGALTAVDANNDGLADWVFVGDNNGRLWQLDAATGENPFGGTTPLYNAGLDDPIATSPAVAVAGGEVVLFFGTGGTDWAPADATHLHKVVAVKAGYHHPDTGQGVGEVLFEHTLPPGEKVFSSPVLTGNILFVGSVVGTVESSDPTQDLPGAGSPVGSVLALDVSNAKAGAAGPPTVVGQVANAGNIRASLHVENDALYGSTIDGKVVQVGNAGNGGQASVPPVQRYFWRQVR